MSIDVRREAHAHASAHGLVPVWKLELDYLTEMRFASLVVERGLPHSSERTWPTERMTLDGLFPYALASYRDRTERAALLDLTEAVGEECVAHVALEFDTAFVHVAAARVEVLAEAEAWIRDRYPEAKPEEQHRVPVTFWSRDNCSQRPATRTIEVGAWADVRANYPERVASQLDALLRAEFRPLHGGQLVLWHGAPGTGKTSALRSLAWEWRSWCRLHYVVDPETFFGRAPRYMLEVLLDAEHDEDEGEDELWRLLVLEDTGELLSADAKERTGQGLARLLNVVDGLIGQGLRVLVLVTTNEPIRRLNPAVSRPGRCAAAVEFAAFDAREAGDWLARRGVDARPREATLAELFALADGVDLPERQRVGFA
jgi:hypothetical protein